MENYGYMIIVVCSLFGNVALLSYIFWKRDNQNRSSTRLLCWANEQLIFIQKKIFKNLAEEIAVILFSSARPFLQEPDIIRLETTWHLFGEQGYLGSWTIDEFIRRILKVVEGEKFQNSADVTHPLCAESIDRINRIVWETMGKVKRGISSSDSDSSDFEEIVTALRSGIDDDVFNGMRQFIKNNCRYLSK